jgi:pimeloyl-ACP methyl ester carboxylesterase
MQPGSSVPATRRRSTAEARRNDTESHDGAVPRAVDRAVEIEYEAFGFADDPTLVLVPGLGSQMLVYDEELCRGFVDRGFHVVRMDNRDSGLSTVLAGDSSYDIADMGGDVVAVLDAAGIDRAIILGFSLGGLIACSVAIDHPERVAGLVSVGSSTGEPGVGQATDEAWAAMVRPDAPDVESQIEQDLVGYRIWSNPEWRDEIRKRAYFERAHARARHPGAAARQLDAFTSHSPRIAELSELDVPTLVVHGALDPLIDASGGRRTAEVIPGAEYLEIEGFSHDLAPQMWAQLISAVTNLSARIEW